MFSTRTGELHRKKAHPTGADDRSDLVEDPWFWCRGGQLLVVVDQGVSIRRHIDGLMHPERFVRSKGVSNIL